MNTRNFLSVCILLLLAHLVQGQQRFNAAFLAGMNLSQIDGDDHSGYRKVGINAGLRGIVNISETFRFSVDLLFSQQGSRSGRLRTLAVSGRRQSPIEIDLTYMEIPVLAHLGYYYRKDDEGYYQRFRFQAGLAYGRLIQSRVWQPESVPDSSPRSIRNLRSEFRKDDLKLVLGLGIFINRHLGLNVFHSNSLQPFYLTDQPDLLNRLSTFHLTFQFFYEL